MTRLDPGVVDAATDAALAALLTGAGHLAARQAVRDCGPITARAAVRAAVVAALDAAHAELVTDARRSAARWPGGLGEPVRHGTAHAYRSCGCRCSECREWKAADSAAYRARRATRREDRP